ncbi:alcohol dehydrogenase catalytic domain-containing protein [Imperialibacter sp. 75]|nr:alcohol dehydrogenase catalytic domain-containing protein [Imperialibacter sp. 75]
MKAFVINGVYDLTSGNQPLQQIELPIPIVADNEMLIRVSCCGACHTELDEIEGRTPPPHYPVVPGHQVVGCVEKCGSKARLFKKGDRVGVAWIYSCCEQCEYCTSGRENLCADFMATGRDANGGYAELMKVPETSAFPIPLIFSDIEAAPLRRSNWLPLAPAGPPAKRPDSWPDGLWSLRSPGAQNGPLFNAPIKGAGFCTK